MEEFEGNNQENAEDAIGQRPTDEPSSNDVKPSDAAGL